MLNKEQLREYRILSGLTYRDVARYCDVSFQLIEEVEKGKTGVTEYNHDEIVKGINRAKQAIARGTFETDKKKQSNMKKKTSAVAEDKTK